MTKNYWTEKEIKYLKENYKYRNKEDLLKNIDHGLGTIQNKAFQLNLTGISINEDFFKNWTPEMAYIFGFWIADGNMWEKNYSISFGSNDYYLLEIIKSNLESGHKIRKNGEKGYQLAFSNKIMYNDLLKLGGIPAKSLTIQFPEVPDEFLHHFIRGEFDGDGCNYIHIDRRRIHNNRSLRSVFIGNVDFLTVLKEKIKEHINIDVNKLYSMKNHNLRTKRLEYYDKKAIALCKYIYKESENLRLERKFEIYDQMKKEYIKELEEKEK